MSQELCAHPAHGVRRYLGRDTEAPVRSTSARDLCRAVKSPSCAVQQRTEGAAGGDKGRWRIFYAQQHSVALFDTRPLTGSLLLPFRTQRKSDFFFFF